MDRCSRAAVLILTGLVAWHCHSPAHAQPATLPATQPIDAPDPGWPRLFETGDYEVVLHQPQVDRWEAYAKLELRAVVVIRKKGAEESQFASLRATAPTSVDLDKRLVLIGPRTLQELRFTGATPEETARLKKILLDALPDEQPMTMALERVFAAVLRSEEERRKLRNADVNLDPPPIYYSDKPAILVMLAGKPRFEPIAGTNLTFAANTNWDLFHDTFRNDYYLLDGDAWLTTRDLLKGPWVGVESIPNDLHRLPEDDNWKDVRDNVPGKQRAPEDVPAVFVSQGPAELITTDGPPQTKPIAGTRLAMVTNTDSDLFWHAVEQQYYFLTAGRWFRARALTGPWITATRDLPADFAAIPEDSAAGEVLASVPGTIQAEEAVFFASVPRRVTLNRRELTLGVTYQGEPRFASIENTAVEYAVNSSFNVFRVGTSYYCCHEGVWFVATSAKGPWTVCDSVPAQLYDIPSTHPAHNVTYVTVESSTPDTVVVASTAGYSGQYIAGGVVMFGAGVVTGALLANSDYWYCHYNSAYFSYGCGARYNYYNGGYYSGYKANYGPYGGGGAWSGYNPSTGVYSRGAYRYGPAASAGVREAYNPWTGNYGARAGASTPYGSWGRSVVSNGDDWARAGHRSGPRGSIGGIETSSGAGMVAGKSRYGSGAVVARDKDGDLYAARNGNVYKRDDSGEWSQRENNNWRKTDDFPSSPRAQGASGRDSINRTQAPNTYRDLDSQANARDRGSYTSGRAQSTRQTPSRSGSRGGGGGRR